MGLPIDLQPRAGPALVVGGGSVAARKVRALAEAGFAITVIAPVIAAEISALHLRRELRTFAPADIEREPWAAIFACTDQRAVNRTIGALARARRIPVVVCDAQDESTFFSPAVLRDGDLTVAVSTGGAAPGLARDLCARIGAALGDGWAATTERARAERARLRGKDRAE
jgi:siroheme synthase-like protein